MAEPKNKILNSGLVEHLSKEIESSTQAMTSFRLKGNFTMFYGPFIALGTFLILIQDGWSDIHFSAFDFALLILLAIFWMWMGYIAYKFEKHSWDKCNHWRKCIAKLQHDHTIILSEEDLVFKHELRTGYMGAYLSQLITFIIMIVLMLRLGGFFTNDSDSKAEHTETSATISHTQ